jgi:beta-galactosidase
MQAIWQNDYMSGDFVWTGYDYKGEPTPYNWPNINSHFGIIDIAGFPKDTFYYYKTVWGNAPTAHVFPHWNWNTGSSVNVWVYANAASVTLYLNGNSQGSKTVTSNTSGMGRIWYSHVEWNVPFAAGNLTAVAYDKSGKQISSDTRITAGEPAAVKLSVEWPKNGQLKANGVDVALVTCEIVDSKGIVGPTATNEVQISLSGSGIILGTGNGYPNSHEPDYPVTPQSANRSAFAGLLRVVVQSSTSAGTITVTAKSANLSTDQISIKVN